MGIVLYGAVLWIVNIILLIIVGNQASKNKKEAERLATKKVSLEKEQEYLDKIYAEFHKDRDNYLRLTKQLQERQQRELERKLAQTEQNQ